MICLFAEVALYGGLEGAFAVISVNSWKKIEGDKHMKKKKKN